MSKNFNKFDDNSAEERMKINEKNIKDRNTALKNDKGRIKDIRDGKNTESGDVITSIEGEIGRRDSNKNLLSIDANAVNKEKLLQKWRSVLDEYRRVIAPLSYNDLPNEQIKAIRKAKEICAEMKRVESGENLNEFDIPEPITPDFICGCSENERFEEIKKLVEMLKKEKLSIEKEMKSIQDSVKIYGLIQFKRMKPVIQNEMDVYKRRKTRIERQIKVLKACLQDKLCRFPDYYISDEVRRVQKLNEDLKLGESEITVSKITASEDPGKVMCVFYLKGKKKII